MSKRHLTLITLSVFIGLIVLTPVAGGAPEQLPTGGIPNEAGVYAACYRLGTGELRLIGTHRRCIDNERRVSWYYRGPAGATGPEGPEGPEGRRDQTGQKGLTAIGRRAAQQRAAGSRGRPGDRTGAEGAEGPQGPAGTGGISGLTVVTARVPATGFDSASPKTPTASCAAGSLAVGGGAEFERGTLPQSDLAKLFLVYAKPAAGATGWTAQALEASPFGETWALSVYATCVTATP